MRKSINASSVFKPRGSYSQVLRVGDFVYVSGQMGIDFESGIKSDLESQVNVLFNNIEVLLKEMNMHLNHIVTTTILLRKDVDLDVFDDLYQKHFKEPYPAMTLAVVDTLRDKDALVELSCHAIDLTAYEMMSQCSDDECDDCGCND